MKRILILMCMLLSYAALLSQETGFSGTDILMGNTGSVKGNGYPAWYTNDIKGSIKIGANLAALNAMSPAFLDEGTLGYAKDVDVWYIWTGAAWIEKTGETIPIEDIQNADIATYSSGHDFRQSALYRVTDASDLGIILMALSDSTLSTEGVGGFLNPDFLDYDGNNNGDYSEVVGLTGIAAGDAVGVWHASRESGDEAIQEGDIVFWNGKHYQFIDDTKDNGTNPATNALAYTMLPKTYGYGYIDEWDAVTYDPENEWIISRQDKRDNYIYQTWMEDDLVLGLGVSAVSLFQWGNDAWYGNDVRGGVINQLNSVGNIYENKLSQEATLYGNTMAVGSEIAGNNLGRAASISGNIMASGSHIYFNVMRQGTAIIGNQTGLSSTINLNELLNNSTISANILGESTSIDYNMIGSDSHILSNILTTTESEIDYNVLMGSSVLTLNTLATGAKISNNILRQDMDISNKTVNANISYDHNDIAYTQASVQTISANFSNNTVLDKLKLITKTAGTSDSILIREGNIIKYKVASIPVGGDYLKLDQATPQTIINGMPTTDGIIYDATPVVGGFVDGKTYYDASYKTISANIAGDVTLQMGQEEHILVNAGENLVNGDVVYFRNVVNDLPNAMKAMADDYTTSLTLGVCTQTISEGSSGLITVRGEVHDINTTGIPYTETWVVGDVLYLSSTTKGAMTNIVPSGSNIEARIGRILEVRGSAGEIYVNQIRAVRVTDLADATISSPILDQTLRYNGTEWVNGAAATSSASAGIEFFQATPSILAVGNNNQRPVSTLSKIPVVTAEQTVVMNCTAGNITFGRAYLYNTALGRTVLNGGVWDFTTYAGVSSTGAGRVSTITRNVYQVVPGVGTLSTVRSGGTATATASTGTPFVTGDGTASLITCGYLQTPQGLYEITVGAVGADQKVATIVVPNGGTPYANETNIPAGNWLVWKLVVTATSEPITAISSAYSEYSKSVSYGNITIAATDKLGSIIFGTSNNTTTITTTYDGTARNSHVATPLITLHNNLAGLDGGDGSVMNHLTAAQLSGLHSNASDHTRSHAITGTSDHTANNWKVWYSNGSGQVTELALPATAVPLVGNGATSAPTFTALTVPGGGTGLTTIGVDYILTGNTTSAMTAEANLTFSGTLLTVTGSANVTTAITTPSISTLSNGALAITPNGAGTLELNEIKTANYDAITHNTSSGAAATVNWTTSNIQHFDLNESTTLTFTAPDGVCHLTLKFIHAANTNAYTVAWPATVDWPGDTAPTFTATSGAVDIVSFLYDGSRYYGMFGNDFR